MARPVADIGTLDENEIDSHLQELADILFLCVHSGAAVSFMLPFESCHAISFWQKTVRPALVAKRRKVIAAKVDGRVIGTVQLDLDTQPNQPHRADVTKMLVHPSFRRLGIARAMMITLERLAADLGRPLIMLDTKTGGEAEALYASLGYRSVGIVPNYALNATNPDFHAATIMFKTLA